LRVSCERLKERGGRRGRGREGEGERERGGERGEGRGERGEGRGETHEQTSRAPCKPDWQDHRE
jgi:hypothetical protein